MARDYQKGLYKDYELLLSKYEKLEIKYALLQQQNKMLKVVEAANEKLKLQLEKEKSENELFAKEILRLKGGLNTDSTNSGIGTSKTPLSKNKIIPNSREKSEKKIGGQPGHPQKKLEAFSDNEVTEIQEHILKGSPHCGGDMAETEESIQKDELDYEVVVIKKCHKFAVCKCIECGRHSHVPIPNRLKEENQYGSRVPALALALMNVGNGCSHYSTGIITVMFIRSYDGKSYFSYI